MEDHFILARKTLKDGAAVFGKNLQVLFKQAEKVLNFEKGSTEGMKHSLKIFLSYAAMECEQLQGRKNRNKKMRTARPVSGRA